MIDAEIANQLAGPMGGTCAPAGQPLRFRVFVP